MPSTDELVLMVAHQYQISRDHYLLTRTRANFQDDATALLKRNLMPVGLVTHIVSQMFSTAGESQGKIEAPKQGKEPVTQEEVKRFRRERKSSEMYPWLRRIGGRRYKVFNLDTRNAQEFNMAIGELGKSLATKVK